VFLEGRTTPPRKNPMALAESFLDLLTRNAHGYRDFGMPVAGMRRDLRKAIDAYYDAELAGDRAALAAAEAEADRVLKASLDGTFSAVMAGLRATAAGEEEA
jgi:hypothetical protein